MGLIRVTCYISFLLMYVEDVFLSVLRTLWSLFAFFCFGSFKTSQSVNTLQLIHEAGFSISFKLAI